MAYKALCMELLPVTLRDMTDNEAAICMVDANLQDGKLTEVPINHMLSEAKCNLKEQIRLPAARIERYSPKGYTAQQKEDIMLLITFPTNP